MPEDMRNPLFYMNTWFAWFNVELVSIESRENIIICYISSSLGVQTHLVILLRIWAFFRAEIALPGARSTKLFMSLAVAPIRPGVTEDLTEADEAPDGATELTVLLTSLLLLALDMLKKKKKQNILFLIRDQLVRVTTYQTTSLRSRWANTEGQAD